jgi:AcrR family transcriptional regulator
VTSLSPPPRVDAGAGRRPRQSRGEQTRLKIKEALTSLLNEQDYFDLAITDVCRAAGVATGGFYFHYAKKADLLNEMIREHNATFWAGLGAALHYQDPYSALYHATTALVRAYLDAPGVVRCFNQLAMTDRIYVKLWDDAATAWVAGLVEQLQSPGEPARESLSATNAYSLLSFVDQLLFKIYIERDPALAAAAGSVDEVIENIAVLWHRALIGSSPPLARLGFAAQGQGV